MRTSRLGQLLTTLVLAISATYMLVYLYRWEWNRALVAGLFFVSAEVAVVATSLLRRLRAIEQRLDARPELHAGIGLGATPLDRIRETAPARLDRFAWLRESAGSMNVFVPVLLGAGVILSLLAHAVERLAAATSASTLERRLAARLEPLALPTGGLLAPRRAQLLDGTANPAGNRMLQRAFVVAVVVLGLVGTTQLIDIVADATQTRSDPALEGSVELTLAVETRGRVADMDETAEALWIACRGVLNRRVRATEPVALGGGTYRMTITPALGEHARRRFVGCLEDATLDRTSGRVVSLLDVA